MYIPTNGISTFYERSGSGVPVVLIHALGSSMFSWDPVARALSRHCDVVAYDWRGHGRTEKAAGEYSLPLLARDLSDLLSSLNIKEACIVGVAVGAMIALQTTLDFPRKVAALVLAEGASEIDSAVAEYTASRAARVESEGMSVAVDTTIERAFSPGFAERHGEVIREFRGDFLANDPRAYASASRVVIGLNVTHRLSEVRCPTLLLAGELDRLLPPSGSRLIQERIPGSRLEILPGVGHFSPIEAPDLFTDHLLTFLGGIGRG
jgi:3-oxoadipate enol-lactonase